MDSFVLNSRQLTLSMLLYVVISNADILLLSSTLSVQVSQPYSATGHTSDPMSLSFNPVPMDGACILNNRETPIHCFYHLSPKYFGFPPTFLTSPHQ